MEKLTEVLGAKCFNPNHRSVAEGKLGRKVYDYNTMHTRREGDIVRFYCPWCGYAAEVDLNDLHNNRVSVLGITGTEYTFEL